MTPHIWLPDDKTQIQVDLNAQDNEVTIYQERFTMILKPVNVPPKGFGKERSDA